MSALRLPLHLVADFGTDDDHAHQALALHALLADFAPQCWNSGSRNLHAAIGIRQISSFASDFPRGGTLVLLGASCMPGPWLEHCGAAQVVVCCQAAQVEALGLLLARLRASAQPQPQPTVAFASAELQSWHTLTGPLLPPLLPSQSPPVAAAGDRPPRPLLALSIPSEPWQISRCRAWSYAGIDICLLAADGTQPARSALPAACTQRPQLLAGPRPDLLCWFAADDRTPLAPTTVLTAMAAGCAVVGPARLPTEWVADGSIRMFTDGEDCHDAVLELAGNANARRALADAARQRACVLDTQARQAHRDFWLARLSA